MSASDSTDWLAEGLGPSIPIVYSRRGGQERGYTSKSEAISGFRRIQRYIGIIMLCSAASGIYLLATDGSLWILAVSHAVGLVIIVLLDVFLGLLNVVGNRRAYIPTLAGALLALVLQVGDIATAPQYGMTVGYFASYLFGLPAFDLLIALQGAVLVLGLVGRGNVEFLASRRRTSRELNYTRKSFIKMMVGLAAVVGFGVALGSIKIDSSSGSGAQGQVASATTPIANTSNLQPNSPIYFIFPAGYPNILFERDDGSLAAFSLLCTHVCCEVSYDTFRSSFSCPCHGSIFDSVGNVLSGPATLPLPTIELNIDASGNIFPVSVKGSSPC